ncbi:hypothetical protein EVAR_25762_1 [Eumeta japonica]|uniref:Uncharacterized protein n=1 Tax=Eumeta variegata TaxID=151549 RepID=A0A4C1V8Z6_EUMVA|nr:hypothetical protein EVAR_25762_1 [Eumeta japonica]
MMSQMARTLTVHSGYADYLFRFKLRGLPYCACNPAKIEDVLHIFEERNMFLRDAQHPAQDAGDVTGGSSATSDESST